MKLHLSLKLRAALLATILTCSSHTLPAAWAKGEAETRAELERTTLTELSQETPSLSSIESAYTLEETTATAADVLHITKYLWDESNITLTPVVYNVNIKPLGSDTSFNWEKDTETGQIKLVKQNSYAATDDVLSSSDYLVRVDDTDMDITRHFVGGRYEVSKTGAVGTTIVEAFGGALSRVDSTLTDFDITGHFIGNSTIARSIDATSTDALAYGGAIYSTAAIDSITSDFIGNHASGTATATIQANTYIRGGAIHSMATIESIMGDFIGNSTMASSKAGSASNADAEGGAIYSRKVITSVMGDFLGNSAIASTQGSSNALGGAIRSLAAIGSITGDFIGNHAQANPDADADVNSYSYAFAHGGAICILSDIESITGDFIGNYATATASNISSAQGGAIWNDGDIKALRANLMNNFVSATFIPNKTEIGGGAIYNQGKIQFLADKSNILISGNYTTTDGGVTKKYEAIFNKWFGFLGGLAIDTTAVIHFNAYEGYSIELNDAISGRSDNPDAIKNQILHINQVMEGTDTLIDPSASVFSTVHFNNKVEYQTINVHAGELILGSFAGEGDAPASYGMLSNSVLNISTGALVEFTLAGLTNSLDIANANTITNNGTLRINFNGETLTQSISSLTPAGNSGTITYTGSLITNADHIDMDYVVTAPDILTLTGGAIKTTLTGTDNIIIAGAVSLEDTLDTTTLHFDTTSGGELAITTSGALSMQGIRVATSNTPFSLTLVSWEDANEVIAFDDFLALIDFNGLDLYETDYTLTHTADGKGYMLSSVIAGFDYAGQTITGDQVVNEDLRHANFNNANAQGANFSTIYLKLASFKEADLRGANFADSYLKGVYFDDAIINGANFSSTRADDEDISTDQIRSTASYQNKDLSDVGFRGVNLDGLDMQGFNLQGTNFTDTGILASQIERADLRGATYDAIQLNAYVTTTGLGDQLIVRNGKLGGALTLYSSTSPSTVQLSDALTLGAGDSLTLQAGQSLYVTMTGSLLVESGSNASINIESALPRSAEWTSEAFITWQSGADILSTDALAAILLINGSSLEDLGLYLSLDNNSYAITNTKPAPDSYTQLSSQGNGGAGGELLDELIQQGKTPSTDIQNVLATLDDIFKDSETGNAESDRLLAAVAGAGVTSLGSAALSNIEGQLTRMRNRAAGLIPAGESQFWISAEAGRNELSGAGTAAGHNINNWGGSVGADWGVAEHCSLGFAFTALYGDLNASSVDSASGELDSYYLSLTTQHQSGKWSHQAAISWGLMDASLDRHISHANGSYSTSAETDGYSYGVMYELGYDIKLSESSTLTPIFNAALIHSYLDGYTETGSDAALRVDAQDNTIATFGIGARVASKLDFGLQVGARALFKADAGDRTQQADVSIASVSGSSARIEGTEAGSFGVELGIGASMPVSDSSALFLDASVEMRERQQDYRASLGYKLDF